MIDHPTFLTLLDPFQETLLPLGDWIESFIEWLVDNFRPVFQAIRWPISHLLDGIEAFFLGIPPLLFVLAVPLIACQIAGVTVASLSFVCLIVLGAIGAWDPAMVTLALVITAVLFCTIIGLPLGILSARGDRFEYVIRPILDTMQTLPAFVYLVPVVMLFGIGSVPGVIVTFVFAVPPLIRLTNLGIRQVPEEVVEAARAFGATPNQVLWDVQIPLASPTILAGLNQSIMLSLSMVVIASLIGVEGLGQMVNRGIGRLDVALASVGGIGIVLLAIVLDRITQSAGRHPSGLPFMDRGPVGGIRNLLRSKSKSQSQEAEA